MYYFVSGRGGEEEEEEEKSLVSPTCCARLCNSWVMAVPRSVQAIGDVLVAQLRDVACAVAVVSFVLLVPAEVAVIEPYETVDGGSHEDVDKDEEVEAESLLQEDSRLDSVSVEPVLPIDIVLPICIPFAFIGFVSVRIETRLRFLYDGISYFSRPKKRRLRLLREPVLFSFFFFGKRYNLSDIVTLEEEEEENRSGDYFSEPADHL